MTLDLQAWDSLDVYSCLAMLEELTLMTLQVDVNYLLRFTFYCIFEC